MLTGLAGWAGADWRDKLRPFAGLWLGTGLLAFIAVLMILLLNPAFAVREVGDRLKRSANLELKSEAARFQFFPHPGLRLDGARLMTADGRQHLLMTAETLTIAMPLRALLSRKLNPGAIALSSPVFNILIDANGEPGWRSERDALDAALAQNSEPGETLDIRISDGSIKFLDERNGLSFTAGQAELAVALDGNGAAEINGSLVIADQFARVDSHVASLARLFQDGSPADLLIEAPALEASFSGLLGLRGGLTLAGTFAAGSDNAAKLAGWAGLLDLSRLRLQELRMSGPLDAQGTRFGSRDLSLRLGGTEFKGNIDLVLGRAQPLLVGKLSTGRLTLLEPWRSAPSQSDGWSTEPLDLGWIKNIDLDLAIDAYRLNFRRSSFGPASLKLVSNGDAFTATLARVAAFGGSLEAELAVDVASAVPAARLRLLADTVDLAQAGRDLASLAWLRGEGDFTLEASAEGTTIEEMVSTLGGSASLSVVQGQLQGVDLPASISAAASGEQKGWVTTAGATGIADMQASFTLRDGIAASEDFTALVAGIKLAAQGNVDLLRRAVDFILTPDDATKAVAIRAVGPWRSPKLSAVAASSIEPAAGGLKKSLVKDTEGN